MSRYLLLVAGALAGSAILVLLESGASLGLVGNPSPSNALSNGSPQSRQLEANDPQSEENNRVRVAQKILSAHMDASGRLRRDLVSEGIAHFRRMKVVTQIGAAAAAPAPPH